MDRLLGRKQQPGQIPPDCVGRFMVVKHSWRGNYARVMCITLTGTAACNGGARCEPPG